MPAIPQDKILVPCPHCGHPQLEPRGAYSTVCKKCGVHYRVQEALQPAHAASRAEPERKHITCFGCAADLAVPVSAQSTMCKRCGAYLDLRDYRISEAVSKNFKTKGTFLVELKGYVFNTEVLVGDAVIRGRFLGKLVAEQTLTIYSTAQIKGCLKAGRLLIPAGNHFRWQDQINVGGAEITGELVARLHADGTIVLKSTARMFGDLEAQHLVVEPGAVVVGHMRITGS